MLKYILKKNLNKLQLKVNGILIKPCQLFEWSTFRCDICEERDEILRGRKKIESEGKLFFIVHTTYST